MTVIRQSYIVDSSACCHVVRQGRRSTGPLAAAFGEMAPVLTKSDILRRPGGVQTDDHLVPVLTDLARCRPSGQARAATAVMRR